MAIKITLDPVRGVVEENVANGSGDALPQGLSPFRLPVTTLTANTTLGADSGGVYVLSSSTGGAKTTTLPLAAASAGMLLALRVGSADAHIVTASQETNGTRSLTLPNALNLTGSTGNRITFPAVIGGSVGLLCDGRNWMVLGGSGSITLAGV